MARACFTPLILQRSPAMLQVQTKQAKRTKHTKQAKQPQPFDTSPGGRKGAILGFFRPSWAHASAISQGL
eukprot:1149683-Pelagomonas_calceolata.AAC.3